MTSDDRARHDRALRRARLAAYPPGEFVGQESFMSAAEVLALARHAGIRPGTTVLDLCCGVAGPGRLIARELGCAYTGVDASPTAVELARARAGDLDARFLLARVPPVPPGPFEVVLLLETVLAFSDKQPLLDGVCAALAPGGRFACTVEEGSPLSPAERARMPASDTVWPIPLPELLSCLDRAGLRVHRLEECSEAHLATVERLLAAFVDDGPGIIGVLGRRAFDDLLAAHRLWRDWLGTGRMRKFALVAEESSIG